MSAPLQPGGGEAGAVADNGAAEGTGSVDAGGTTTPSTATSPPVVADSVPAPLIAGAGGASGAAHDGVEPHVDGGAPAAAVSSCAGAGAGSGASGAPAAAAPPHFPEDVATASGYPLLPRGGTPVARGREGDGDLPASELLTVIVTTSPVVSNPDTEMLEWVLRSFNHVEELAHCRRLIVCDGVARQVDAQAAQKLKRGRVHESLVPKYREFVCRISAAAAAASDDDPAWRRTTVLVLNRHCGFSYAVRAGLAAAVTPFVMVVQHDFAFTRRVNLRAILRAMCAHPDVLKYVKVLCTSTIRYPLRCIDRYSIAVDDHIRVMSGVLLMPLVFMYDKIHVARRDWYLDTVMRHPRVRRGVFLEDTLGHAMLATIKCEGMAAHAAYGTWLMFDVQLPASVYKMPPAGTWACEGDEATVGPAVRHMHGRRYLTRRERRERWNVDASSQGLEPAVVAAGAAGSGDGDGKPPEPVDPGDAAAYVSGEDVRADDGAS